MKKKVKIWISIIVILAIIGMFMGEDEDELALEDNTVDSQSLEAQIYGEFMDISLERLKELYDRYDEQYGSELTQEIVLQEAEEADTIEEQVMVELANKYGYTVDEIEEIIIRQAIK